MLNGAGRGTPEQFCYFMTSMMNAPIANDMAHTRANVIGSMLISRGARAIDRTFWLVLGLANP